MKNLSIEQLNEIKFAEECGLTYTGNNSEGEPEYIGDNRAWSRFDDGDNS
jgi:hypothetical protein